jgi:hypothetical protein
MACRTQLEAARLTDRVRQTKDSCFGTSDDLIPISVLLKLTPICAPCTHFLLQRRKTGLPNPVSSRKNSASSPALPVSSISASRSEISVKKPSQDRVPSIVITLIGSGRSNFTRGSAPS